MENSTIMPELIKFAEVSFPVAVSIYLLIRMEKRLQALTNAILELKFSILSNDPNGKHEQI
jgi:hypothetical protein